MLSRLAWRRSTAAVGIYGSALFGFLGTVVAFRALGPRDFGLLAIVLAASGFFQLLLDLSTEDAVVKYGFRYSTQGDWGRLRRLLGVAIRVKALGGVLAAAAIAALSPLAEPLFGSDRLLVPMLVSALLPLAQAPYGVGAATLLLRGRYDVRGLVQGLAMALRFIGLAIGSLIGITATVVALVVAQVVASGVTALVGWLAFKRFPSAPSVPIGPGGREVRRFVFSSTLGTAIDSARGMLAPLLLGVVAQPAQVAYFRTAQAPQLGFAALSSPVRLVLLTEQTRDFERGDLHRFGSMLRRYIGGSALLMLVVVPPALWLMPDLLRVAYGSKALPATDAARLILLAAAVQVVWGWTKSFPVSIGRPNLRVVAQSVELAALVPALVVLGGRWHATGAAAAVLLSVVAFALAWVVIVIRLRREPLGFGSVPPEEVSAG